MKYVPPLGATDPNASYQDGNPEAGILGSIVPAAAIERPQREIMHVITQAGLEPSGEALTQLYQAITALIGTAGRNLYAVCSTAAATAAKAVSCAGFTLAAGSRITVRFTVTNTADSPTLNVSGTGAKAIRYRNAAIAAGTLAANRTYGFVYDGTYFQLVGDIDTNTTYKNMAGATASAAGKAGLAPAPAAGAQGKYLRGDGTWQTPPNTTYSIATATKDGLMSKTDKKSVDYCEALRLSMIGVPRYWRSTTLPENHVWANGDLVLFSDWPELKKVYDDGGFAGMLLAYNADSATIAANLGKWRPNAAKPTGLYVPKLDGQFFRACTGAGQAGETVTDKGRNISGTWVTGWNAALIPTIGTGGAVYTTSSQANEVAYSSNIKVSQPFHVGFDSALVWDEHDGDEFVPAHVHIPLTLYMGRTA